MDRLQSAFGMNGAVLESDTELSAVDGGRRLSLQTQGALPWSYSSADTVASSGVASACASDVPECVPETTVPQRPADFPSENDARSRALDVLRYVGVEVDKATVEVDDGGSSW